MRWRFDGNGLTCNCNPKYCRLRCAFRRRKIGGRRIMPMRSSFSFAQTVLTTFSLGVATEALAQNAPMALRSKSIVAAWTENRLQRLEGMGEFRPRSVPNTLQI